MLSRVIHFFKLLFNSGDFASNLFELTEKVAKIEEKLNKHSEAIKELQTKEHTSQKENPLPPAKREDCFYQGDILRLNNSDARYCRYCFENSGVLKELMEFDDEYHQFEDCYKCPECKAQIMKP